MAHAGRPWEGHARLLRRWGFRAGTTVVDQGLASGAGFAFHLGLARWLTAADYGAFAVAFAVLLLAAGLHNALVLEPLAVLGPGNYRSRLGPYLASVWWLHLGTSLLLALLFVAGAWCVSPPGLHTALLWMGLASPCMHSYWYARRRLYAEAEGRGAAAASAVYGACLLAGVAALKALGWLTLATAAQLLGVAGAAAAWTALRRRPLRRPRLSLRAVAAVHWRYGRWLLAGAVIGGSVRQLQTVIAASLLGLAGAGVLRAMMNFVLPVVHLTTALGLLAVPLLARDFGAGRIRALRRKAALLAAALTLLAGGYEMALLLGYGPLEHLVYRGRYGEYAWLLPLLGMSGVFHAVATGFAYVLRAIQRPQYYLVVAVATGPAGVLGVLVFTWLWGLPGAALSMIWLAVLTLGVHYVLFRRWFPAARPPVTKPRPAALPVAARDTA